MSKSKVLVTGAAGFIAFHLIDELLKNGVEVVGVDNFDPFYSPVVKKKNIRDLQETSKMTGTPFSFQKLDIQNLVPSWNRRMQFSHVVHLAAKEGVQPSIENPLDYAETNVTGTLQVYEFCKHREIENVIFGSSSSVYGDQTIAPFREESSCHFPISPYAMTKRAGELMAHTYGHLTGIKTAVLRFFTTYGPRQRPDLAIHKFTAAIASGKPIPVFGNGDTARDYTHVSDIIHGIEATMNWLEKKPAKTYEIFNLGGSQLTTVSELVELIEAGLNKRAILKYQPEQPGDVQQTFADLTKARQTLGYFPRVTLDIGIADFLDWYMEGLGRSGRRKDRRRAA
jgi:UDP-glucuronate 4-epimerase